MRIISWWCDNCGKNFDFPRNEVPLAPFICLGETWKFKHCPGTVGPEDFHQTSQSDGDEKHG